MFDSLRPVRSTRQTRPSITGSRRNKHMATTYGSLVAGQTRLSLYVPNYKSGYVWRGRENRLAAKLQAKLDELGIS